ncbi:MAG TPA: DUF3160 domain-containing protein, partial [Bacteroidota bacterium]|nr:DUF3160 domain-containing protein [Bacteroidota bacterium]
MNSLLKSIAIALFVPISFLQGQQNNFDINAYQSFLSAHQNLSAVQTQAIHPAGNFKGTASTDTAGQPYFRKIDSCFHLTADEKTLFQNHGFVVSERLNALSFGQALTNIYSNDLPVFISADAILQPFHTSYDALLMNMEVSKIIPSLDNLLLNMYQTIPVLAQRYDTIPAMTTMLKDLDVYITVARNLLDKNIAPKYADNVSVADSLLALIATLSPQQFPLFSSTLRTIDFSQFQIRGHYTQDTVLGKYFQTMMWLGRTEMYLIAPKSDDPLQQKPADIQRQTILAYLVAEAAETGNAVSLIDTVDTIIKLFAGDQDNVTLPNLQSLRSQLGFSSASALLDTNQVNAFQSLLATQSYAFQRINSQILMSNPFTPDQIQPAASFLLFGQRFVVDSYVTGNVVYDKIIYNNQKILRMLPNTLDVLFALGNNAAAQLLQPELDYYHYGTNLAALRFLVDAYDSTFWQSSFYNGWLNAIRTLNPPADRTALPKFMQTASWWQEKMNTQLASWAELRHDNLLYAKQSYTSGVMCSYPQSYVEPVPAFYQALKQFCSNAETKLSSYNVASVTSFFHRFGLIADTLASIAAKELTQTSLTQAEKTFLASMLVFEGECGFPYTGWYTQLFYQFYYHNISGNNFTTQNYVVADFHTAPTDSAGNPVGWVMHAGTGPVNMAVIAAPLPDGTPCAFIGPVFSYYECTTTNFNRLTDDEWKTMYAQSPSSR